MRSPALVLGLMTVSLVLAACNADVVMRTQRPLPGTNDTLAYAAQSGEMATEIIGNPFDVPQAETNAAVLDAMAGSYAGPDVRFTTTPPPSAPEGYVVVVLLNGRPGMDATLLCDQRDRVAPMPERGLTTAVITFCAGDQTLNGVSARMPQAASPKDPAFRAMIARAMIELIPTREKEASDLDR